MTTESCFRICGSCSQSNELSYDYLFFYVVSCDFTVVSCDFTVVSCDFTDSSCDFTRLLMIYRGCLGFNSF